jgi:hypothetical protein
MKFFADWLMVYWGIEANLVAYKMYKFLASLLSFLQQQHPPDMTGTFETCCSNVGSTDTALGVAYIVKL